MRSMFLDRLSNWISRLRQNDKTKRRFLIFLELLLIGFWALWVGREYLNFDPSIVPSGREFGSAIQTHHLWTRFKECGWCAIWNGSERGGYPAFADVQGSMLHPLIIITTLIWGVISGVKISLVVSFWVAGVAQWWLARELKLSWLPRLWSAGIAVVGGHLAGRMELGVAGVVLSTAMSSLIFAGVLYVARGGGRRAAVVLGVVTASAIIAGQGYLQLGLLGILPALSFLLLDREFNLIPVWKDYALAAGLALLFAAPFLIPVAHFYPNFVKDSDPEFKSAQALQYLPLNLVINNWQYYKSEILGKFPYPYLYTLYIGWVPMILAVVGLSMKKREDRYWLWFLLSSAILEFFIASAIPLKWLANYFPGISGIRHPPLTAGLAVPTILGLSAYGLERLLNLDWPIVWLGFSDDSNFQRRKVSFKWLLLIPLILSLRSGYQFTTNWIHTTKQGQGINNLLEHLKTENLQWINPPYGEHFFVEPAISMGLKLSPGIKPWSWRDRELPIPYLEVARSGVPEGPVEQVDVVDEVTIYARYDQPYAAVVDDAGNQEPCQATGTGGRLQVECNNSMAGKLIVKENTWTGWKAWLDGERVRLLGNQWLEVEAPPGKHTFFFRYLPWDVPLGLALLVIGVLFTIWLWRSPENKGSPSEEEVASPMEELTKQVLSSESME